MKKILTLSLFITFLGVTGVYAQTTQTNSTTLEVPIQGQTTVADLPAYISLVYNFAIGIVGLAALIMIGVGGYLYMTSHGNASQAEKGKEFITDAILGLVIVLVSYVVLRTINPNLVGNFSVDFSKMKTGGDAPPATWGLGQGLTQEQRNQYTQDYNNLTRERYFNNPEWVNNTPLNPGPNFQRVQDQRQKYSALQQRLNQLSIDSGALARRDFVNNVNGLGHNNPPSLDEIDEELNAFDDAVTARERGMSGGAH